MSVNLRPTLPEDIDFITDAENDPENTPYVGQWSREQHLAVLDDGDYAHLIIEDAEDRMPVGYLILIGLQNPHQNVQLRRMVVTCRGLGHGRTALRLVKKLVFENHRAHRLWLDVMEHNQRAWDLYQSEGFVVEGKQRECLKAGDTFISLIGMSMLVSEYCPVEEKSGVT